MRTGVQEYTNEQNQLHVLRLHYTADPAKRSAAWRTQESRNLPRRGWLREYEINWATPEGEPVVPEFSADLHVRSLTIHDDLRPLRFWDFGWVAPVVLFSQLTMHDQLLVHRELSPFNTSLHVLWPMAESVTMNLFPKMKPFDAGDPAGENQTDLGASAQYLAQKGVRLYSTRPGTEISYQAIRNRFKRMIHIPNVGLEPAILIDPRCRNLVDALTGAFHLTENPPYKPVKKHPFKDVVDALRYGNDCLSLERKDYQQALEQMASNDRIDTVGVYR